MAKQKVLPTQHYSGYAADLNQPPTEEQALSSIGQIEPAAYTPAPAQQEQPLTEAELLQRYQAQIAGARNAPLIPGAAMESKDVVGNDYKRAQLQKVFDYIQAKKQMGQRYSAEMEANPLYPQYKDLLDRQRGVVEEQAAQPAEMDTRGMLMLTKAAGGPDLSGFYKPPVDTFAPRVEAYQGNIKDLYKQLSDAVKTQKATESQDALTTALTMKAITEQKQPMLHKGPDKEDANFWKFLDHFKSDKVVQDAVAARDTASQLKDALKDRNWLTDGNIRGMIVELRKLKPVSDRDLNQAAGSPQMMSVVNRAIEKYVLTGQLFTDDEAAQIERWVNTLSHKAQQILYEKEKLYRTKIAPGIHGLDQKAASTALESVTSPEPYKDVPAGSSPEAQKILDKYRKKNAPK